MLRSGRSGDPQRPGVGIVIGSIRQKWRERFFSNIDQVRAMNFPETFIRMWEYYLCYCEGGFAERYIGDVQMLLTKPLCHRTPLSPPLMERQISDFLNTVTFLT